MRKIGELKSETEAGVFGAALYVRGMENDVETEDDGAFSIWVHDHDKRDEAVALLEKFRSAPDAAEWHAAAPTAKRMKKEEERRDAQRASHVVTRERMEYERRFAGFASVPVVFAVIAIVVTIVAGEVGLLPSSWMPPMGQTEDVAEMQISKQRYEWRQRLAMTEWQSDALKRDPLKFIKTVNEHGANSIAVKWLFFDPTLPEVRRGEVWRLFSSIFVHFGILHLVFNLMWLRDLGGFIQNRFGAIYLLALSAVIAVISNYAQLLWGGPFGGGLSGVVYGLFGFMWMRGKFDRTALFQVNPQVVQMMMVWFFLCFTPLLPNIANAAHTMGLISGGVAGMITGMIASRRRRAG